MRLHKNLYRVLLITSFLAINGLVIYGIAAAWKFLNTGADRSKMLHLTQKLEEAYLPKINWDLSSQEGRKMEKQTLKELEEDYRSAWYVKQIAFLNNDPFGLDDFYTQDAKEQVLRVLKINANQKTTVKATTLEHNPKLEFYSLDGKLAVLTDKNVSSYEEVYQEKQLVYRQQSTNSYRVILLLEDGFWRIRQKVKIQGEAKSKRSSSTVRKMGSLKGINYYPKAYPWQMFGEHFDESVIQSDFGVIRNLGFNTVRIFIPYEDFGGPKVHQREMSQLKTLFDLAGNEDLKVLVTLFDFYGNYDVTDWTLTHRYAEAIVQSLRDHPALFGWDIKNEPDLDFENRGKDNVLSWLTVMSELIGKWDDKHPITIGWSNPEAATNLHKLVDFVSFHYYEDPETFQERYSILRNAVGSKPLVLEEFGKSSYGGIWNAFTGSSKKQADYLNSMSRIIAEEQLSYFIWTLYDFEDIPDKVVGKRPWRKAYQRHFGLLDAEGNQKPGAKHISTMQKEKGQ